MTLRANSMRISVKCNGRIMAWRITTTALFLEEEPGYVLERNWAWLKSQHSFTTSSHNTGWLTSFYQFNSMAQLSTDKFLHCSLTFFIIIIIVNEIIFFSGFRWEESEGIEIVKFPRVEARNGLPIRVSKY